MTSLAARQADMRNRLRKAIQSGDTSTIAFCERELARPAEAYARHLRRCAPELVEHEASVNSDRVLRLCMLTLRELRQARLDKADAVLAEAETLTDWQSIAEARREQ